MDIDERKRSIISRIYYNPIGGFGSIVATHKKAHDVDSSITRADVKTFLEKQAVRQRKDIPRYNSFIPDGQLEQIQINLAVFGKAQSRFRYGLIAIDVFTKCLVVVPLADKRSTTTAHALDVVVQKMGLPSAVLTDEGG